MKESGLSIIRQFRRHYLSYFSKPRSDHCLYRAIVRRSVTSIVELGIGLAHRSRRMIQVAEAGSSARIRYTGIDEFESRSAQGEAGIPLKEAHQFLRPTGAKIQLTPGDPFSALARTANSLTGTDLLVVSADLDAASLRSAWFYIPRMLHARTLVFLEEPAPDGEGMRFVQLAAGEVNRLADLCRPCYRRAA